MLRELDPAANKTRMVELATPQHERDSGRYAAVPGSAGGADVRMTASASLRSPLTCSPRMAGYDTELDAFGRFRHMADPIKVFWQPH